MAFEESLLQTGSFTSDGQRRIISVRNDLDLMVVHNFTQAGVQQNPGRGVEFFWQRGFADGAAIEYNKANGADTLQMTTIANGGFRLVDTTASPLGQLLPTTGINGAGGAGGSPRVTTGNTGNLQNGDVVRLYNTNDAQQLMGMDFTVTNVTANTRFDLVYAPGVANAANAGNFRVIRFDPFYQPQRYFIGSITQANQATVTLTVDHTLEVGQEVRFIVPDIYGMGEVDGVTATITAVDTAGNNNDITVDVDTNNFNAFAYPGGNVGAFTQAQIIPYGSGKIQGTGDDQTTLADSTINTGVIGMELAAGVDSPAGSNNDVIYWAAHKAARVRN